MQTGAGNQFEGRVIGYKTGAVNAKVVIDVGAGVQIAAILTQGILQSTGLAAGRMATDLFKASSILNGTKN